MVKEANKVEKRKATTLFLLGLDLGKFYAEIILDFALAGAHLRSRLKASK
jgi:uncharacterized membrane protein